MYWNGIVQVMLSYGYKDAVPLGRCYNTRGMAYGCNDVDLLARYAKLPVEITSRWLRYA